VISPDEMNHALGTTVVAPMTTGGHAYPWRVPVRFSRKDGWIALDQMRTVDRERLDRKLGVLPDETAAELLQRLAEMFAP
jgi:mRNA interferase MazF